MAPRENGLDYDGIVSGPTIYAYVEGNPVRSIDPSGLAPGDHYSSADAAAIQAINDILPTSIQQNAEYAGHIYQLPDGSYSYTAPNTIGDPHQSLPNNSPAPDGTTDDAYYHTHAAAEPDYDSENFSPPDKAFADRYGLDGYLGTPSGKIYKYKHHPGKKYGGTIIKLQRWKRAPC